MLDWGKFMKKLFAVMLVCTVFGLQAMSNQNSGVDIAAQMSLVIQQEEQGIFSRARVDHELSQARAEKLADVTGPLSDEEYNQIALSYRAFIGENRVRLVNKKDDSECNGLTVLPDCMIKTQVLWADEVQNVVSAGSSYRALMHCVWTRERELTRQQLLEDIADIMAMNDQLSMLAKKLDGTNEIQMHFIDIIGYENGQKQATLLTRAEEVIASHRVRKEALNRAQFRSSVSRVVLGTCVLVGGYVGCKYFSAIRERVVALYQYLIGNKKSVQKSQKVASVETRASV